MYELPHFAEPRIEVQHALIRDYPLGQLICQDQEGRLTANPIPFEINPGAGALGTLNAHLAKANPQWLQLERAQDCLIIFQGPQGYVSPGWYASKQQHGKVVPTWNYATVHVWGKPTVIHDQLWLREQLAQLTAHHEASQQDPWQPEDAPAEFISQLLNGIVGLSIAISRIEGKWKVSQNRPAADIDGVRVGHAAAGQTELAQLVEARRPPLS